MLDAHQTNPQTTVAQLVGGKYNNNRFGTMTGMAANRRGQIKKRGGSAYSPTNLLTMEGLYPITWGRVFLFM